MNFQKRRRFNGGSRSNVIFTIMISLLIAVILMLYWLNSRIMPTYVQYAEMQTIKVASFVVSKAINARTTDVLDVNNIIEHLPPGTSDMVTTKFNTDIINRVRAETTGLVKEYLEQAENGNLSHLPSLENVEYDVGAMEAGEGIVFFVPLAQAANLPIIGNLGPKIPIRLHLIGNVNSDVSTTIREFGINNAYVEVTIHIAVNVQFIVPFATEATTIEQRIPVAIGLIQGSVPQIYTTGDGATQPSIEVPIKSE